MKCPKCYKENLPRAIFCSGCGAKLNAVEKSIYKQENKTQISQSISNGNATGNSRDIIIGRASSCDIVINDPSVSSKHTRIFVEESKLYIEDLRSLNGTFVSGKKINSKTLLHNSDKVFLGNVPLSLSQPILSNMLVNYGGESYSYDSGTLHLKMNTKWLGKVSYFIMIILLFFPWLTVRSTGISVSFTAFDFAFNKFPVDLGINKIINPEYGPVHTLFLILFLGVVAGLVLNFFNLKISEKFNVVNILSIVLFVITVGYLSLVSSVDNLFGMVSVVLQHNFSAYLFIFICFLSIFEGLLEFHIINKKE